jgi:hypothetical protein
MWEKPKLEKPNIAIEMISEPNVATMVETHSKLDTTTIEVDNQMVIIQIQVGKNILEDVLLDGGASVNIITKNHKTELGLPKPRPFPYHFKMADQNMTKPLGIIKNLKIYTWYTIYSYIYCVEKQSSRF